MDTLRALYENLIVVAFDSTPCDENSSPLGTELTEMAWLTYDMALHQVNNTKQFFIKPDYAPKVLGERPILRSASPLKDVVQQFDNYIANLMKMGKSYCIITDGFWELKQGLREESRSKGVKLGAHFNKFFDVKIEFLRTYPRVQGIDMSLNSMIIALGMHPLERSSALDDCKSMVILIERMNKDGHSFNAPEVLPESFNTTAPPAQSLHSSTVVKLRGLPWEADETAFEDFFKQAELAPVDALVVLNHQNRPSGLGFVRFATADEAQRALTCHKRYMGHRFIEVFRCLDADYDRMVAKGHGYKRVIHKQSGSGVVASAGSTIDATQLVANVPQQQDLMVKLRGLPWSSTVADIQRFLEPLLIPAQAIHIQFTGDNRPSGEAFIDLTSEEQVQLALKKHREMMGPRYVEVFRMSRRDTLPAQQQPVTPVIAVPGLGVVPSRVVPTAGLMAPGPVGGLVVANNNVNSVALTPVTMVPPQMHVGGVPMTVQPGLVMAQHNPFAVGPLKTEIAQPMMNIGTPGMGARTFVIKMRGMPWTATEQDIAAFFDPFRVISATTLRDKFDRATGEALVEFENDEMTTKAMSKHKGMMGTRYIELFRVSRADLANASSAPVAPIGGPVAKRERNVPGPNMNKGSGVTLKMRGLPYHATVDDVAEFFKGYNFVRESIRFGTWNDKPSGEAWVTFTSNDEANSALAAKQHDYIGNRYIDLFLI